MPSPELIGWLAQLALSFVAAAAASWLTVQWSLGQFRQQKWWEAKHQAYTALVAALHEVKRDAEELMRAYELQSEISASDRAEVLKAHSDLQRLADMGELVLSRGAIDAIREFYKSYYAVSDAEGYYLMLEGLRNAAADALERFVPIATGDLELGRPKFRLPWAN